MKEQHKKKKTKTESSDSKYSHLTVPKLRMMLKPFGIPGIGDMLKDELLQLCLLYDSELNGQ